MLRVSTSASWLPSSTGSTLGKRARTEPDCSGGGRVRKRSQEQHPGTCCCLPCMDWSDAPGPWEPVQRSCKEGQQQCAGLGRAHCICTSMPEQLPSRSGNASQHGYSMAQPGTSYMVLVALSGKDTTKESKPGRSIPACLHLLPISRGDHEPKTLPLSERMHRVETHAQCKAVLGAEEVVKTAYLALKSCSPK